METTTINNPRSNDSWPLLTNCGNRWEMIGWHASNEPTEAQQLLNTVEPIEIIFGVIVEG